MRFPALLPCLLLSFSAVAGQADSTKGLTLRKAVALALANHPSLRSADAQLRAADAGLTQALSSYFPSLTASATASRTDGAFVFNPSFPPRNQTFNSYSTAFNLTQMLYDFGRTSGKVSANNDFVDAASLDAQSIRDLVIVNVQVAYFGLLRAQRVLIVNRQAMDQATRHLAQAQAFYKVGRRHLFDVTKAEVDVANGTVNLLRAENDVQVATVQLTNAMGTFSERSFLMGDTLGIPLVTLTLDSVKEIAQRERPDLRSARTRVSANRALASSLWSQHLPTLSAFGTWTWSNFDFPLFSRWNAGVTLTLPLFQGFSIAGQVEQAEANADLAQATADLMAQSILLEVEHSYLSLKEAEKRIGATEKLVEQAQQNLTLAEKQYAAGIGTPLETTDAQLTLSNAQITNILGLYDYNVSLARLNRAMGRIQERSTGIE